MFVLLARALTTGIRMADAVPVALADESGVKSCKQAEDEVATKMAVVEIEA